MALIPHLKLKKPYDPIKDFSPVGLFATTGNALLVSANSPIKTLAELISRAKAAPGKMNFGSWGVASGGHLMGEYMKKLADIDIVHVPFKGTPESLLALLNGDIDMMFAGYGLATNQIQSGKVRALAVSAKQRGPTLPNIPTFSELGIPLAIDGWFGLIAPAGTPSDIVNKLNNAMTSISKQGDLADRIATLGMKLAPSSPAEFGSLIQRDFQTWGNIVKDAKVSAE
jgi:tripartite-type tricarboxylate transporter receptor subunit TctC